MSCTGRRSEVNMVLKRQCPITKGSPTSMTEKTFAICCDRQKKAAKDQVRQDKETPARMIFFTPICLTCKTRPEELTIIELPAPGGATAREAEMAAEKTAMAARKNGKEWQGKVDEMEMLLAQRSRMIEEYAAETQMMAKRIAALIDCLREDYGCSAAEIDALLEV